MPRPLSLALNRIMKGETERREPGWQVLVYDLRSSVADTVRSIVTEDVLEAVTGPLDISDLVEQVDVEENPARYASGGVASSQVQLRIIDGDGRLDPLLTISDPDAAGRWFRDGNVVRIREGDYQVPTTDWPFTFTGIIRGQVGYVRSRATGDSQLDVKAVGRESTFLGFKRTTEEFLLNQSYLEMAESVAQNEMGLDAGEIAFPTFGTTLVAHKVVQLVEEDPLTMLARIGFLDLLMPKFDGEGKLTMVRDRGTGAPSRVYVTSTHLRDITRPQAEVQPANTVTVLGLESELSLNEMPRQVLATLDITTGYFTQPEAVEVYWRDDRTLFASDVELKVFVSVNGGINVLGTGESITPIESGDPDQVGIIGATLQADTGFAPWLVVFLLVTYVGLSYIQDLVVTVGFGASEGFTIPVGRIAQAVALSAALFTMSLIGRGSYAFMGCPFEYVYAEIREAAKVTGTPEFDENELELENHLVTTSAAAASIAFEQLVLQQAEKSPREIGMLHDVGLIPNDLFELEDGSRLLAGRISRTLRRDAGAVIATVEALDVTADISVGT